MTVIFYFIKTWQFHVCSAWIWKMNNFHLAKKMCMSCLITWTCMLSARQYSNIPFVFDASDFMKTSTHIRVVDCCWHWQKLRNGSGGGALFWQKWWWWRQLDVPTGSKLKHTDCSHQAGKLLNLVISSDQQELSYFRLKMHFSENFRLWIFKHSSLAIHTLSTWYKDHTTLKDAKLQTDF